MTEESQNSPNKIVLVDRSGAVTLQVTAEILANGDLQVAGFDSSSDIKKIYGEHIDDYEFYFTVAKVQKDRVLLALLKKIYQGQQNDLIGWDKWLKSQGIPYEFSNWHSPS